MKIHMVGIGGISMRGLACYLRDAGHHVTGCDVNPIMLPNQTVILGHTASHIVDVDEVVINSAITPSHPGWIEVQAAERAGIPVRKRAEKIGELTRARPTIAISGTHGKSTTTGMIAHLLLAAKKDPFVMIGAPVATFGGQTYRAGSGPLVLEADEFDRSFLQFTPQIAVVTNIEADHLDYYRGGLPEIIETFYQFLQTVPRAGQLILNRDDQRIVQILTDHPELAEHAQIITYGRQPTCDYVVAAPTLSDQTNTFSVGWRGERQMFHLHVPGLYNQENATAAFIVGQLMSLSAARTRTALESFRGVGMRFESLLNTPDCVIISDYGHHPTEVAVTTEAARAWFPKRRIVLVFQPHQYARTALFFDDFVRALSVADATIVTDIYGVPGREETRTIRAQEVARAVKSSRGVPARYFSVDQLVSGLEKVRQPGDVFLMMGAGLDIRPAAERLANSLAQSYGQATS